MDFNLPGKGLYNEAGLKKRLDFLNSNGIDTRFLNDNTIKAEALGSNIENFIGALTIPMGLIGPLKRRQLNILNTLD